MRQEALPLQEAADVIDPLVRDLMHPQPTRVDACWLNSRPLLSPFEGARVTTPLHKTRSTRVKYYGGNKT